MKKSQENNITLVILRKKSKLKEQIYKNSISFIDSYCPDLFDTIISVLLPRELGIGEEIVETSDNYLIFSENNNKPENINDYLILPISFVDYDTTNGKIYLDDVFKTEIIK